MNEIKMVTNIKLAEMAVEYNQSARRLILLDYDGTLVNIQSHPLDVIPSEKVLYIIKTLASDQRNTIAIITGRDQMYISKWFGDMNVYIFAEHGSFIKEPGLEWVNLYNADQTWKEKILPILKSFTAQNSGSLIEEKVSSIAWHYRNVNSEQQKDVTENLFHRLKNIITPDMEVSILEGKKVIEIKQSGFDKGSSCKKMLALKKFSFILSIGDDVTDEDMFKALPLHAYTFKVGYGPSRAKMNIENPTEVINILTNLI